MRNGNGHGPKDSLPDNGRKPLGSIDVPGGQIAVSVMNDVFSNYHFTKEEYWEDLRTIANTYITGYADEYPKTTMETVKGKINVETQYVKFKNPDKKIDMQDFRLTGENITYLEFQNEPRTKPALEERSAGYFGMGVAIAAGKTSNQIWLMAKDNDNLMHGRKCTYYVLADERTGKRHPNRSGIMFASLTKMSEEDTPAGELSKLLLGLRGPSDSYRHGEVKRIAENFKKGFEAFKEDKEATNMLTFAERKIMEGEIKGEARGEARGKIEILHTELGLSPEEIAKKLNMEVGQVKDILEQMGLHEAA